MFQSILRRASIGIWTNRLHRYVRLVELCGLGLYFASFGHRTTLEIGAKVWYLPLGLIAPELGLLPEALVGRCWCAGHSPAHLLLLLLGFVTLESRWCAAGGHTSSEYKTLQH